MSDITSDEAEVREPPTRVSRPTLAQVRRVISFMVKHPDLAHRKLRVGLGPAKFKKLWTELSDIVNSMEGARKTTKGWIKFWSDKRRSIIIKQKQIEQGKLRGKLSPLEQEILDMCEEQNLAPKKKKVKEEPCNGDDDIAELYGDSEAKEDEYQVECSKLYPSEAEERQLNMMDKLVQVMGQQSAALTQMAEASLSQSKALERVAEASHVQAIAIDRLAGTFENISASVHDIRNAIIGIDYTMKRCYPVNGTSLRENSNIFS
ncbi:uncharacterized protein LOC113501695 [Trichoplusia ni]|uniref:Uncharacterized protein LOC113501695 n=1 Tax=Trichoplusia ni TaxID=7111 RepID=A0A7E5WD99_TRINI|nr:uncharacterized protein LOC113501695 [Trichoplusia ni]